MSGAPLVIVGTGLAGYTLAREFRKLDKDTPLVLVTSDDGGSYSKPMLSNALDKGKTADDLLMADARKMAADLDAEILTDTRATAIDTARQCVATSAGELDYRDLVLALGADPVRPPLDGDAAGQVLSVNDRQDYARFRAAVDGASHVAIIGAGLIGCEFANDLARAGIRSTVIDPAPLPLARLLPADVAESMRDALSGIGIGWCLGVTVEIVEQAASGLRLVLSDGTAIEADAALSAIGLAPRTRLAADAGIEVAHGIATNRLLQTSVAHVYALGDCAEVEGLWLPYVMPLMNGARALARTLTGEPTPVSYPAMPVVVKTPDFPVAVCPPPPQTACDWELERTDDGWRGLCRTPDGELTGFCVSQGRLAERPALAKQTVALLPDA